jgi:hypothetical protein
MNEDAESWRLAVEIAHQWLSHLVTPTSLGDARINKALANYVAMLAAKQVCVCTSVSFFFQNKHDVFLHDSSL